MPRRYVAVCGGSDATPSQLDAAREVGKLLARSGAVVVNGGYGGVMDAVSEGAASEGGTVVGNFLIVTAAESVIAIGQGWGTLSEIALARRLGRSVFALDTWDVQGLEVVKSPAEAVARALEA